MSWERMGEEKKTIKYEEERYGKGNKKIGKEGKKRRGKREEKKRKVWEEWDLGGGEEEKERKVRKEEYGGRGG